MVSSANHSPFHDPVILNVVADSKAPATVRDRGFDRVALSAKRFARKYISRRP